ncbi:hypothetical protein Tco_0814671 [Tanacetum coccineum]
MSSDSASSEESDSPEAAPASPNYVPGPEEPYHVPPSPNYVPSPEYRKYLASADDEIKDSEDGPVDYPANGGDDDDDDDDSIMMTRWMRRL